MSETITTDLWRLRAPRARRLGRTAVIVTVHPAGDQRILRCAQSALDAGYDVRFVWLAARGVEVRPHPRVHEVRLAAHPSTWGRLRVIPALYRAAVRSGGDLWHIHDFYLLPAGWLLSRRTRRPVVYDVHEYYPEYYASKLPIPSPLRGLAERVIGRMECALARRLGGVNAVSDNIAARFARAGALAVATPNYPAPATPPSAALPLSPERLRRVIHIGTLTPEYGSEVLLDLAHLLATSEPSIEVLAIMRFPSDRARNQFESILRERGRPPNLTLVEPLPAYQVAALLAPCGIGLSLLQDSGQAPLAVPTKLYEYVHAGLAMVCSDLPATRDFVAAHGVGQVVPPHDASRYAASISSLQRQPGITARTATAARAAVDELCWDAVCSARIRQLYDDLDGAPPEPASVGVTSDDM